MAIDYLNAFGQAEATRHQVPLILAWVSCVFAGRDTNTTDRPTGLDNSQK